MPAPIIIATITMPAIVVKSVGSDSGGDVGVEVGEVVGEGVAVGVEVGEGVIEGVSGGISGALGFGSVKTGMKLTLPKLKSSSKSKIELLISWVSVVPHQLLLASMLLEVSSK